LKTHAHYKNVLQDYERAFEVLDKNDVIEPNVAHILRSYGCVKMVSKDYERTLENLDKINVFKPNNVSP
jgi:tetratricopeptide (TPR) repeat protein